MNKSFHASLDELPAMLEHVKCEAFKIPFKIYEISKIVLAAEEAIVNVISYGYPDSPPGTIEISCLTDQEKGIDIIIRDDGIPYNPLENDVFIIVPERSVEHRKIGGVGILVIIRIMDNVTYVREGEYNVLTLSKFL